jgi:hypothetical protein
MCRLVRGVCQLRDAVANEPVERGGIVVPLGFTPNTGAGRRRRGCGVAPLPEQGVRWPLWRAGERGRRRVHTTAGCATGVDCKPQTHGEGVPFPIRGDRVLDDRRSAGWYPRLTDRLDEKA